MFGNFSQQLKKSTKPASTLFEMNAKALESVSKEHTALFSGVMSDSVKLMDSLFAQTEIKGLMTAQTAYAESLRDRLTTASKSTYGEVSSYSKNVAIVMKESLETATQDAQAAVDAAVKTGGKQVAKTVITPTVKKTASKAKAPVKKAVAKKAVAKKPAEAKTPAVKAKAEKVSTVKAESVKVEPVTTEVAKKVEAVVTDKAVKPQATPSVVEKPVVKKAVAKKASAPKKSAVTSKKAVAKKTVAKLSPADVKATTPESK